MALKVWLPLNGDLENKGISDITVTNNGATVDDNGKIGKCYSFNNNSISIISTTLQDIFQNSTQAFSFATWIYLNTDETDRVIIFGNYSANPFVNWELTVDGKQRLCAGGTSNYTNKGNSTAVPKTTWTHIAVTYDGNTTTFYQNGIKTDSATGANTITTKTPSSTFYLGSDTRTGATRLKGKLNDMRIYDHCLSPLEVKEISQGLILHYKLDGFSGGSGRNLLRKPTTSTGYGARNELTTLTFSGWDKYADLDLVNMNWNNQVGKKLTYRCWLENIEQTAGTGTGIMLHVRYADGTYQQYGGGKNGTNGSYLSQGETGWVYLTITIPNPATRSNPTTITKIQASIRHNSSTGVSTVKYKNSQVELGDYPTSFGFAPEDLGIDITKIIDSSGYGNDGFLINGTNEAIGINNGRYQVCTSLLGTTVDTTSNTITGAQYLYAPFEMPAWNAITVAWWGNNIAYGRGGIFETTGTTGNIWEGSDYNTTAIANWDSTFGIFNGSTRVNIFNNFIKDSTWHHHAITFDGANVKYYCDSVLKQTSALTGTLPAITGFKMGLGKAGGVYRQIKQKLNDLRIYTTALSAEDIATLYHTPTQIDNLGGMHGFEMNEISSNILTLKSFEQGGLGDANGAEVALNTRIRTVYLPIIPSAEYKTFTSSGFVVRGVHFYTENQSWISYSSGNSQTMNFIIPESCYYIRIVFQRTNANTELLLSNLNLVNPVLTGIIEKNSSLLNDEYNININKNGIIYGNHFNISKKSSIDKTGIIEATNFIEK